MNNNAKIIDGHAVSKLIYNDIDIKIKMLAKKNIIPGLAVIVVGNDPASKIYVKNKIIACQKYGIFSMKQEFSEDITENELLNFIEKLNINLKIHGILVQLPLPKHINSKKIIEAINPKKDVDGFSPSNIGRLVTNDPLFIPCTPYGILKILENQNIDFKSLEIVVIGTSNIVGKPIAMLMLNKGATVTLCNSKTKNLSLHTKNADIVIVATGKINTINGSMIKQGAIVVDVGINRNKEGKICGDVEFTSASQIASAITPVPGGVGPMTIAMLIYNTVRSAEIQQNLNN
ncbi:Bifunctional protein FolD protein [Candidatus Kinetoplastibacterium sorsogonicusi]|uniref:Bifunctional protein FolD n=1 Tax=Candidatus Kinetoplastidibacterium kentomonadis TaxID=1576550 RepID=A0A3S7J9Q7_9PROT|nr:bifunctional methylenetetrahydrofolate dehydrogenase/methenyltetrahydrofolate cyclohydrolase FolD [Candidatus Kinetoplastibacterium sorsogonicusi]AWD32403.1 Bifunctional protein FolD protein [Candidatus Kinetoplastibacterium sorsogonicusi]